MENLTIHSPSVGNQEGVKEARRFIKNLKELSKYIDESGTVNDIVRNLNNEIKENASINSTKDVDLYLKCKDIVSFHRETGVTFDVRKDCVIVSHSHWDRYGGVAPKPHKKEKFTLAEFYSTYGEC